MIDTISLRYHQVNSKYPHILKNVFLIGKTDKKSRFQSNQNLISGKIYQSFQSFITIPSSGYDIHFFYEENVDCLRVSLSIPKFYYGQNLSQHIMTIYPILDKQLNVQLHLIHLFIQDFNREVLGSPVMGEDIEIDRLDFCFNIFFTTKQKSLEFLQIIKESKIKYLGDRSNLYVYNTSIQYRGDGYSWKFYHKGTEMGAYQGNYIKHIADRVMRFEVTIRRRKMSLLCSPMFPERDKENDTKMRFFAADTFIYPIFTMNETCFLTIGNFFIEKFLELLPIENYIYSFDLPKKLRAILVNGGINKAVQSGIIVERTAQRYRAYLKTINKELLKTKLDFDISYQHYIELSPMFALNQKKTIKIY